MGYAGGEHPQRRELLVPFDECLALDELDTQRRNHVAIDHDAETATEEKQQSQRSQQEPPLAADDAAGFGEDTSHSLPVGVGESVVQAQQAFRFGADAAEFG